MRYLFGIILLILTACGQKEEVVKPKEVLKVALANKPRSFDPQRNTDSSTLAVTKQIYNNLFSLDENGDVVSELVEKYSIGEDKSITLQLKKGILFHDGSDCFRSELCADSDHPELDHQPAYRNRIHDSGNLHRKKNLQTERTLILDRMFVKNRLSGNRKPVLFLGNLLTKTNGAYIMCIYMKRGRS